MSGHSKWSQIRHKKAKADAARGRIFSKLIREITIAARLSGGDPTANPRLRSAVEAAREVNMPLENIERAIKRGTGELPGSAYEEVEYEGYGPGGVAIMVKALTDNRNRTASEIRHIFDRFGGGLGSTGSVAWQFNPKGVIFVSQASYDEETVLAAALEAGAEDVVSTGSSYQITVLPDRFESAKQKLKEQGIEYESAELTRLPQSTVRPEERDAERVLRLYEALEEHEDVQAVYANFDIPEEVMERISSRLHSGR